jgi:hypothetical protein
VTESDPEGTNEKNTKESQRLPSALTWTSRCTRVVREHVAQDWLHKLQDRTGIIFASCGIVLDPFESLGTISVLASEFRTDDAFYSSTKA